MRYIITGGAGFIGSHLAEKLVKSKCKVIVLDNLTVGTKKNLKNIIKRIEFRKIDICNFNKLKKIFKKGDIVFHLAALADIVPSIVNPDKYFQSNVIGTYNVLKAAKEKKVSRLIYTASSSCYGIAKKIPTPENYPIKPMYPYALTKKLGEDLVIHWSKLYKLNMSSVRLFNVYGPRVRTSGSYGAVFGVFMAQLVNDKPLTLVGDGSQRRDFTYVSDVVDIMIKLSKRKDLSGEIFNIGSGKSISINYIIKLLGAKKVVKIPKRPGEPDITFANIKKISKIMKWKPKVTIENGIKNLIKEKSFWKNAPLWNPIKIKFATKLWFKYLT